MESDLKKFGSYARKTETRNENLGENMIPEPNRDR